MVSDVQNGPDWWLGTDGKWYPPAAPAAPTMPSEEDTLPPPPTGDELPAGDDDQESARRRRWLLPVLGLVIVVLILVGAGAYLAFGRSSDSGHQLTGSILLEDPVSMAGKIGEACSGDGGYDDMRSGAQVKVSDDSGKVLATGYLATGSSVTAIPGRSMMYCNFEILVTKKLPKRDFYVIEVSHRGAMTYSYDDLEAQDWNLSLTLG